MKAWQCVGECGMIQVIPDSDPGPEDCENCNGNVRAVIITAGWTPHANLGCASTRELLEELQVRFDGYRNQSAATLIAILEQAGVVSREQLDYRTVDH